MARIIGVIHTNFTAQDGTLIEGDTVHITEPISAERGIGESGDRFFLSRAKLSSLDFVPAPGQTVEVFYNKFGKVASLKLVSDDSIVID